MSCHFNVRIIFGISMLEMFLEIKKLFNQRGIAINTQEDNLPIH
jgi:hypothetical protein